MSLETSHAEVLYFRRPLAGPVKPQVSLELRNRNSLPVVFRIKTTSPKLFTTKPPAGIVQPNETVIIIVTLEGYHDEPPVSYRSRDKFLVLSVEYTPEDEAGIDFSNPALASKALFEKLVDPLYSNGKVIQKRLRVQFVPAAQDGATNGTVDDGGDNNANTGEVPQDGRDDEPLSPEDEGSTGEWVPRRSPVPPPPLTSDELIGAVGSSNSIPKVGSHTPIPALTADEFLIGAPSAARSYNVVKRSHLPVIDELEGLINPRFRRLSNPAAALSSEPAQASSSSSSLTPTSNGLLALSPPNGVKLDQGLAAASLMEDPNASPLRQRRQRIPEPLAPAGDQARGRAVIAPRDLDDAAPGVNDLQQPEPDSFFQRGVPVWMVGVLILATGLTVRYM